MSDTGENNSMSISQETDTLKEEKVAGSNHARCSNASASMMISDVIDPPPPATPDRHDDKPPDAKCARRDPENHFKSRFVLRTF